MPTISPQLPNDGDDATVAAYNPILIAIIALLNGQLDADNFSAGSLPWSVMDSFTDTIPANAMEDEGNLIKFRSESSINFVADGIVWSPSTGLGASMTEGVVYTTAGTRVKVNAVNDRQFTASKDTYIDISPTGSVSYSEVNNNVAAPVVTAGYLRVAVVTTSASSVTAVHSLAKRTSGNEIGRFTAGANTNVLSVQNLPPKKHITIRCLLLASGGLDSSATFNNDTGSSYNYREIDNNDSGTSRINSTNIGIDDSDANGTTFVEFKFYNVLSRWKSGIMESLIQTSGSTAPNQRTNYFMWKNTTQDFNRIDIVNAGSGTFAAGAEIIVYGDD